MTKEEFNCFWPQLDAAVYGIFDSYSQRDTLDKFVPLLLPNPVLAAPVAASTVPLNLDPVTPSSPPVSTIISPSPHQIYPLLHSRKSTPPQTTTLPQALHHQSHARTRCPSYDATTITIGPFKSTAFHPRLAAETPRPAIPTTVPPATTHTVLFAPSTIVLVSPGFHATAAKLQRRAALQYFVVVEEDDGNVETNALIGFGLSHVEGALGHLNLSFDLEEDNGHPPITRNQIVPLDADAKTERFPGNYVRRFGPMEKWENELYGPFRNHGEDGPIFSGGLDIDESIRPSIFCEVDNYCFS